MFSQHKDTNGMLRIILLAWAFAFGLGPAYAADRTSSYGTPPAAETYRFFGFDPAKAKDGVITVKEGPDLELIKRNDYFGYTPEEIEKTFHHVITLKYDFNGFDPESVKPPPAPGIHPRVLFGPEDLPSLRDKLKNTDPGRKIMAAIKKELNKHIRTPDSATTKGYRALIKGDTSVDIHKNISIAYGAAYEAFRCLIEDDAEGGKEVARAITTIAEIDQAAFEGSIRKYKKENPDALQIDFRLTSKHTSQNGVLGLMYDWAYPWMTKQQRDTVRKSISVASSNMTLIGAQTLRTPRTSGSNWISWTSRLVTLLAAIEGEAGYDPGSYERVVYALKWFYALSIFPDGESMEGWGKQFMMAELAYILARRGEPIIALQNVVRGPFENFWLHALNPWGSTNGTGPFTFYDSQGGTGNNIASIVDVLVYKRLYPKNPYIDFIFRNAVGEDYGRYESRVNLRHHFSTYTGFCMAIFAARYGESKAWDEALTDVTKDMPLTFYGSDTGTMITRSCWKKDALYLYFLPKNIMGGHKYADRGHFNVYAEGRHWGVYHVMRQVREAYWPMNRSTVLIDGEGGSLAPGKSIAYNDQPLSTFAACDLKITYDYISNYLLPAEDRNNIVQLPHSYNDFRLTRSDRPTWDMPIEQRPDWLTSRKPGPIRDRPHPTHYWTKRPIPMQKAFRTVGMVRGPHPYILVIDDIRKDSNVRTYQWGMTLANDVVLSRTDMDADKASFRADATLGEQDKTAAESRHLLCRMVRAEGLSGKTPEVIKVVSKNPPQPDKILPKLVFTARTSDPRFICLITGENKNHPAPTTRWNASNSELTIQWSDQKDIVILKENNAGRTIPVVKRDGKIVGGL